MDHWEWNISVFWTVVDEIIPDSWNILWLSLTILYLYWSPLTTVENNESHAFKIRNKWSLDEIKWHNLTWNLKMMVSKRNLLFQGFFSGSMLNFRGVDYQIRVIRYFSNSSLVWEFQALGWRSKSWWSICQWMALLCGTPSWWKKNCAAHWLGEKKKLQVNQVVPGLSRIQLMNPYPNSTVRDWYATLGMTMRVCLRNASDKLNFQISNPQIRLFCCLETHQSPSLVQNLRKWEVPSSFVGGQCLSWGGEMTWVSKIQPMNQWFSSQWYDGRSHE